MQKNNVNMVVFDQNQSFMTEQSHMNYNTNRRATTTDGYTSNQPQSIISNEINFLNQKLNNLQEKADKIQQYIKLTNLNSNNSQTGANSNSNNNNASVNPAQIQELLRVVQLKIQIIVQQTKKIIQKMTTQFDKKLSKASSQKNHQANSIVKIQTHCRDTITKIQQGYQQQLNMIRNEHVHLEKRLIQKVQQIENDYKLKLKDFKSKQQQYLMTIEQLESKLRVNCSNLSNITNKSKKMIEVTQDKPSSSMKSQFNDNISNMSSQRIGSTQGIVNPNDVSRRRTKIFQGKSSNKSVSPNNQVLSPLKSQNNKNQATQNLAKPKIPDSNRHNPVYSSQQVNNNYNNYISETKQAYQNLQVRATVVPESNSTNQSFPRSLTQKVIRSEQQNLLNQPPRKQTLKQPIKQFPKVQWQRFQDFNDEDDSGGDEDVFFYPEHNQKQTQQPKSVFDYECNNSNISDSMHSPFDLK